MIFSYCPDCGNKLVKKEIGDEGFVPYCMSCNKPLFSFSYPCVICLIMNENDEIALIKQSYVSQNYICVAGYVKQCETIEDTAKREVEEETGLAVSEAQYMKSYYYEKQDTLMFGFVCKVTNSEFNISVEVDEARWFSIDEAQDQLRQGSIGKDLLADYLLCAKLHI